ncbi:MAG: hypothetical protein N3A01_04060 [Bacteroidales bacterium]|nr:hypothetical protein [Bacteroidales bacterium]
MKVEKIVKIVLLIGIFVLIILIINSVSKPIKFEKEKNKRYAAIISQLKLIRTAELAFYDKYGYYTANFDSLINFIKTDSLVVIKSIGFVPDTLTEEQALKMKLIIRDTIKVAVKDTLFPKNFVPDSLKYVPYSGGLIFNLKAGEITTQSKVKVKVFEASDPKPFDPTFQLKVGSMEEPTTAGNWE